MQHLREKYINLEIQRSFKVITNYLEKLESYDYYSHHPLDFLKYLKNFIHEVEDNLDEIPNTSIYRGSLLSFLNNDFIQILRYIQRSQTRHIPWSLISNIELLINDLQLSDYTIILRPQWHWNYSILIREELISFLANKIHFLTKSKKIISNNQKVHVISFPILERTNFLLHTIISHEIGHFIQEEYFKQVETDLLQEQRYKDIQKKLTSLNDKISEDKIVVEIDKILAIYEGMIREIIPDIIGYKIFGPSILYSSYFLTFWNKDLDTPSVENDYYPPLKFRIRILFELLSEDLNKSKSSKNFSFTSLVSFNKTIGSYLKNREDINLLSTDSSLNEAFKLFNKNKSSILDFCEKRVSNNYKMNFTKLDYLIDRIKNTIPPNEYKNSPVQLADIFLSGWIYYYNDLVNTKNYINENTLYVKNYSTLNKLLLHAANLIYVQKEFIKNVNTK